MNQYVVMKNQQIAIEAENPDEALKKVLNGEGTASGGSYNVQLRPTPPQPQTRGVGATTVQIPA